MIYNIIPFLIIIAALAVIIYIVWRKLPKLKNLEIEDFPQARQAEIKLSLIEKRLKRKFSNLYQKAKLQDIKDKISKLAFNLTKLVAGQAQKVWQQKRKILKQKEKTAKVEEGDSGFKQYTKELLAEASGLQEQELFKEAEEKYIEIIGIDAKNIEAYQGLADLYIEQKEWKHAETTLEHVLKLGQALDASNASDYVDLAVVKRELQKDAEAMHYFEKAYDLESSNPRILDLYLDMSIRCQDKELSWQLYKKLKKVNPENQKMDEWLKRVKEL